MATLPRALHPATNAPGLMATSGAVYAAAVMIYNGHYHHGVISTPVIIAAVAAIGSLLTRFVVTPTADPVDGAGRPLVPAPAFASGGVVRPAGPGDDVPALLDRGSVHVVTPQPVGAPQVLIEEAPAAEPLA